MSRRVARWQAALSGAGVLVAVGALTAQPFLLVAAIVPLWYVMVGSLSRVPAGAALRAERRIDATNPQPGRPVEIELTVTNVGDRTLADVRVVDGVPEALTVVEGTPRLATALRPGDETTITYAVAARRGTYEFDAPAARLRPLAATDLASASLPVAGEESLTAGHAVSRAPLAEAALPRAGTHPTDAGGGGTEFHATREYRPGDAVHRIDWRSYAKTGELATVEYRAERAARTVLVVDARPAGRVTAAAGYPNGVELCAFAAERLCYAFGTAGVATSVVAVGLEDDDVPGGLDPDGFAWVDGSDDGQDVARLARVFEWIHAAGDRRERPADGPATAGDTAAAEDGETTTADEEAATGAAATVADGGTDRAAGANTGENGGTEPADGDGGSDPADGDEGGARIGRLLARLPPSAQVVVVTPLLDDWPLDLVTSLTAHGHPTTVLSPDATGGDPRGDGSGVPDSPGQQTVAMERAVRRRSLPVGTTVVDWDVDRPLDVALRESAARGFDG